MIVGRYLEDGVTISCDFCDGGKAGSPGTFIRYHLLTEHPATYELAMFAGEVEIVSSLHPKTTHKRYCHPESGSWHWRER